MAEIDFSSRLVDFFNSISKNDEMSDTPSIISKMQSLISEADTIEAHNTKKFLELVNGLLQIDLDPSNQHCIEQIIDIIEEKLAMWEKPEFRLPEILNYIASRLITQDSSDEQLDLAEKICKKAMNYSRIMGDYSLISLSAQNLANVYVKSGEFLKAARLFEIGASIEQKDEEIARCLFNTSLLYYRAGHLEKSLNLLKNAIKFEKLLSHDVSHLLSFQNDLSREYALKNFAENTGKALNYLYEAIKSIEASEDSYELAEVYDEAASIHQKLSNPEEAIKNRLLSLQYAFKCGYNDLYFSGIFKLIMLYMELEKFEEALAVIESIKSSTLPVKSETLDIITGLENKIHQWVEKIKKRSSKVDAIEVESGNVEDSVKQPPDIRETSPAVESAAVSFNFSDTVTGIISSPSEVEEQVADNGYDDTADIQILDASDTELLTEETRAESVRPQEQETTIKPEEGSIREGTRQQRRSYSRLKKRLLSFYRKHGYRVSTNVVPFGSNSSVDIVAQKGTVRKHKIFIQISQNPADAEISSYILRGISEKGNKVIFLIEGNEKDVYIPRGEDLHIYSK
ncbi:MAG: tetratricopeptide repeat protein, partial [Candidatus Hodarchaeales archaeon]